MRAFTVFIGILDRDSSNNFKVNEEKKLIKQIINNSQVNNNYFKVWKEGDTFDFEYSESNYKIIVTKIYDVPIGRPGDKIDVEIYKYPY